MVVTRKVKTGKPRTARKPVASPDRLHVSLPTKPIEPPDKLTDYSICLFGEKGVGKTSLAAQFPDSLVFMWEPRRRNLRIKQVPGPDEEPLDWERFKAYLDKVLSQKKTIRTVVIDTVDRAYQCCQNTVCYNKGVKHPSDMNDYGATWYECRREFEDVMNRLLYNDILPIFISHCRLRPVVTRTGEDFDLVQPTCPDACWQYLKATCDFAFYYGYHGPERSITLRGNELVWSSCGVDDHFLTPDGNFLSEFPAGESAKEAYKNLTAAFDNKLRGYSVEEE